MKKIHYVDNINVDAGMHNIVTKECLEYSVVKYRAQKCPGCADVWIASVDQREIRFTHMVIRKWEAKTHIVSSNPNAEHKPSTQHYAMLMYKSEFKDEQYNGVFDPLLEGLFKKAHYFDKFKHLAK